MPIKDKKIYVIYTGGTIGMVKSDRGFIPDESVLQDRLANLKRLYFNDLPDFTLHQYPDLIDSSNVTPYNWVIMAQDISDHYDLYDGFVILHGTDTMAYTASSLSFMLENLGKPVIITGSQIPLIEPRSDGIDNIMHSLLLAANPIFNEVMVYFGKKLLRGNRSTKANASSMDAFDSPNYPMLAKVGVEITINKHLLLPKPTKPFRFLKHQKIPKIVRITLFPGLDAFILHSILTTPIDGVVLATFGAGNMMNSPEIIAELVEASKRGIYMINCTQCFKGRVDMDSYATGLGQIGARNIFSGYDMTSEAALSKLIYVLSMNLPEDKIKSSLATNLCGEMTIKE